MAEALGAALGDVVGRHESLRTLFVAAEGIPQQLVVAAERADVGWQVVDAAGWSVSRLDEAIDTVTGYSFDLAAEIPLRARLFRIAEDEHVLVAVVHHIAADGLSVAPLVRDLGVAYASRCAGRAPGWADLPVQYVDYTLWQREQLGDLEDSDSRIGAQLAYWQQTLAGMPERLQLPTDRPYPPEADQRGARVAVDWPVELQQRVRGWPVSTMRPASWWCRRPWRCCCRSSVPAPMWRWGSRSPGGVIRRWMSWWGRSSTPWCCGLIWLGIPQCAELLAQVRAAQPGRLRASGCAL